MHQGAYVMEFRQLILSINGAVDALEYATARRFIEENFDIVYEYRHLLNSNAREILEFVKEKMQSGEEPLTKKELNAITVINTYAKRMDIRGLKLFLSEKGKEKIFEKKDAFEILSSDAKILLASLGFIKNKELVK